MVQWKGEITEDAGGKAARLDSLENLDVPNFFVIEREELTQLSDGSREPDELMQQEFPEELGKRIEDAFGEVGMSSEVREASGKARNLVGGQRNGERVSVRVSGDRQGVFDYRLNVGASSLERAIKEVAASFYRAETGHEHPAIIVQKMVDPDYTGAAVSNYLGGKGLVETVEGLGAPLEKGITTPALYLMDGGVEEERMPEQQVKVSRNNLSGDHERETVRPEPPFSREELEQFFHQVRESGLDVKFTYSRGTFYIVDAFPSRSANPFESGKVSLDALRVSEGEIEGEVGREVSFSDDTLSPEEYTDALIASKGGYTSRHAQQARQQEKPAIFSFPGRLQEGQHVSLDAREVEIEDAEEAPQDRQYSGAATTATRVLELDGREGLALSPPFDGARYAVTDRNTRAETIPRSGYLDSYAKIFSFEGDRAVIDARRLGRDGLEEAMEYLDAELKLLVVGSLGSEAVRKAIETGFDGIASRDPSRLEKIVEREERRFMLDRLRELPE